VFAHVRSWFGEGVGTYTAEPSAALLSASTALDWRCL
jgi:hypothetical protein